MNEGLLALGAGIQCAVRTDRAGRSGLVGLVAGVSSVVVAMLVVTIGLAFHFGAAVTAIAVCRHSPRALRMVLRSPDQSWPRDASHTPVTTDVSERLVVAGRARARERPSSRQMSACDCLCFG